MWVICIGCHRAVEIKPLPKNKRLRCSACGSVVARTVRQIKTSMLNGGQMPPDAAKALTHAGLLSIAVHRGYKPGWAAMKFKLIYGYWPDGKPEPERPSGELMWWIKQEGRAYAKMMREKEGGEWKKDGRSRASRFNPTGNTNQESALMSKEDYEVEI